MPFGARTSTANRNVLWTMSPTWRPFAIGLLSVLWFSVSFSALAGAEDQRIYIERWKDEAIRQMFEHRIPASITLAQGILESGSGKSQLSLKSNNHFGIKCHKDWQGDRTYHDDDAKDECFRVYDDPRDSYRDHSLFLKKKRYAPLFELDIQDYKGWARGLKRCGYATSPTYAKALIELIERHDLDRYDDEGLAWMRRGEMPDRMAVADNPARPNGGAEETTRAVNLSGSRLGGITDNDVTWVQARQGETLGDIAASMELAVWQLRKYNDLDGAKAGTPIAADRRLYTQPKRRRGTRHWHVVQSGETLRTISDAEAVKLKVLMARTGKSADEALPVGFKVPLRFPPKEDGSLPWYAGSGGSS